LSSINTNTSDDAAFFQVGAMQDTGENTGPGGKWVAGAVPEPSTYVIMIAGLAMLAWRLRRRAAAQPPQSGMPPPGSACRAQQLPHQTSPFPA
jgi:hypothetical protein